MSLAFFSRDTSGTAPRADAGAARAAGSGHLVTSIEDAEGGFVKASLATVSVDGSAVEPLTTQPAGEFGVYDASPAVSPDGETVAFWRVPEPKSRRERPRPRVYLIGIAGTALRPLTEGPAFEIEPAWSPDGDRLVFARRAGRHFDLFTAASDGSGLTPLTHSAGTDELEPSWSPDGARIAYTRLRAGHGDLWTVNADGTGTEALLEGEHDDSTPSWSPDGTQIAFIRDGHVAVADADGADVRLITGADASNDWRPSWSPDGTRIVFSREPGKILLVDPDGRNLVRVKMKTRAAGATWEPTP